MFSKENKNFFSVKTETGNKLLFRVISMTDKEVELARGNYHGKTYVIPQNVTFDGVTYTVVGVGEKAFYECDFLQTIELPKTIRYIGKEAFEDCRFKEFIIPDSLKMIEEDAFNNTFLKQKEASVSRLCKRRFMHPLVQGEFRLYKISSVPPRMAEHHGTLQREYRLYNNNSETPRQYFFRNDVSGEIKSVAYSRLDLNYDVLLQRLFLEYITSTIDSVAYRSYFTPVLRKVERTNDPENRYSGVSEIDKSCIKDLSIATTIGDLDINFYNFEDDIISLIVGGISPSYSFIIRNKTNNTLKIVWDDAVFADIDGGVSKVMHNGVKYAEKENSQPSTSIIKGGTLSDRIIPTQFVRYQNDDWIVADNYTEDVNGIVRIMLPIQIKDVINEYLFEFSLEKKVEEYVIKVHPKPYYK